MSRPLAGEAVIKNSRTVYLPPEQWTYFKTVKHHRRRRGRTSKHQNTAAGAVDEPPKLKTWPPKPWTYLQTSKHGRPNRGGTSKRQNMAAEGLDVPPRHYF